MNRKIEKECESSCEYILPDYMGDIKKLLASRARVIPTGKFVDGDSLLVSGSVEYEILYADSENKLTSVVTGSDYEMTVAIDGESYADAGEVYSVGMPLVRVTGPRKLSVRSAVNARLTVNDGKKEEIGGDAFSDGRELETLLSEVEYERCVFGKSHEREYAEEIARLREVKCEELEIVSSHARIRISDTHADTDCVSLKGEITVEGIIRNGDTPPFVVKKSFPFEERVDTVGAASGMFTTAEGYITSLSCSALAEGEECVIVANLITEYATSAYESYTEQVITDAYLKEYGTDNSYGTLRYQKVVERLEKDLDLCFKISRSDIGCTELREIMGMSIDLRSVSAAQSGNTLRFEGDAVICGVACELNENGKAVFLPIKQQTKFEADVNLTCQIPEEAVFDYTLTPTDISVSVDGECVFVDCRATVRASVSQPKEITYLRACTVREDERYELGRSRITVYYPTGEETLFSVAKRFHTTPARLAEDNGISESVFADASTSVLGKKRIIIR